MRNRRDLWIALAAVALGLCCFWVTAAQADWFVNRPFTYSGPRFYSGTFIQAGVRGLAPTESVLELSAIVFLLPAIFVACRSLARAIDETSLSRISDAVAKRSAVVVGVAAALAALGAAFVSQVLIRGAAIVDDERAYEFQAQLFSHGRLALAAPPAALHNPMFITTPVWASKYPPGNSLVLAVGVLLGDARVVRPALAALLVYFVYVFVQSMFGKRQAIVAAALTALSPFVWAQYGTLMAYGTTACACAAFLAGLARAAETGRLRFALLAGLALGWMGITRPHEAFALGAPVLVLLLVHAIRGFPDARSRFLGVLIGAAAIVWIVPLHNYLVGGSPFRFPWLPKSSFSLGFRQVFPSINYQHSVGAAIANFVPPAVRYDLWMLGYPGSMLLVLAGLLRGERSRFDALLAAMLASFATFMALVFTSGTWDVGPSYYFVCFPILIAIAIRGWDWCLTRATRTGDAPLRRALWWLPIAGLATCWVAVAPMLFLSIAALCEEIRAPWDFIARAPYGDFLVALGSPLERRAPGWSAGYPYSIPTGPSTRAQLFYPHSDEELAEAMRYLGPELPVYRLEVDKALFDREGQRVYSLVPLQHAK